MHTAHIHTCEHALMPLIYFNYKLSVYESSSRKIPSTKLLDYAKSNLCISLEQPIIHSILLLMTMMGLDISNILLGPVL